MIRSVPLTFYKYLEQNGHKTEDFKRKKTFQQRKTKEKKFAHHLADITKLLN